MGYIPPLPNVNSIQNLKTIAGIQSQSAIFLLCKGLAGYSNQSIIAYAIHSSTMNPLPTGTKVFIFTLLPPNSVSTSATIPGRASSPLYIIEANYSHFAPFPTPPGLPRKIQIFYQNPVYKYLCSQNWTSFTGSRRPSRVI